MNVMNVQKSLKVAEISAVTAGTKKQDIEEEPIKPVHTWTAAEVCE